MTNELVPQSAWQIAPRNIEEALHASQYILKSGLAPGSFRSAEAIIVAIQTGAEIGFGPMASLQNLCVINGKCTLYGRGLPAIVLRSGLMTKFSERREGTGDDLKAFCTVARKGIDGERTESFGVADAKKAGLWNKAGPWTGYPGDMLMYKARARAFTLFADVLCGLSVFEDIQGHENDASSANASTPANEKVEKQLIPLKTVQSAVAATPEPTQANPEADDSPPSRQSIQDLLTLRVEKMGIDNVKTLIKSATGKTTFKECQTADELIKLRGALTNG